MTSLIGCLIEVKLKSGERYEGILKTFSSEFQLALCSAALIDNIDEEKRCQPTTNSTSNNIGNLLAALEREENVVETLVINAKNLVTFKAVNVDLDFATKKAVMTDSEIAKHDGNAKQHRELVPWDGGDDSIDGHDSLGLDSSLDDHSGLSLGGIGGSGNVSNGWKTEDMFKLNESKYNIETTYQDDMSEYTIKLEHRNDEEYRQREAQ
ncbi:ataxin-2-like protein, partial [Euroglyphus maynei]